MSHFNVFRRNLYRFISEDEYRENRVLQHFFNSKALSLLRKSGGVRGKELPVEFIFYTDDEDKATNLSIELGKRGYEIYSIDSDGSDNRWSVTGKTNAMKIDNKTITKWSRQMVDLGYENDCDFSGWQMLLRETVN